MIKLKSAMKALKNRWVFSILLVIQFTLGLSTITYSVNFFYNMFFLKNHSIIDITSTYLITSDNFIKEEDSSKEEVEEIYKKLEKNKDVISYGTYIEDNVEINSSTRPLDPKMIADLTNTRMQMEKPTIQAITIDKNYNSLLNLQITQGRGFSDQDFKNSRNDKTNILVGSYFKKYFSLGDVINNQYRIIGFLPEDQFIVNDNNSNTYQKLDKAMLIPMSADIENDYGSMLGRLQQSTILKLRPDADIDELNQIIQLKTDHSQMHLKNLAKDINQNVTDSSYSEIPQMILDLCFILFSIIGIVVTTMVSIMIRKREFGIKLVLGESKFGIFGQIILENTLIGIVGFGVSLAYFTWKASGALKLSNELNQASILDIKLNMLILFFVFLILLLIIVISNLIIFFTIRKLEPKSLIGGME